MTTVRDENGVEKFVLCDLSAPSKWVRATATNGAPEAQAPEGNEEAAVDGLPTTETATDLLVDCMQAMKQQMDTMTERMEAMTERMDARMEAMQDEQARQLELQEVQLQIAWAERHEEECEAEAERLQSELKRHEAKCEAETRRLEAETKRLEGDLKLKKAKRVEATAELQDLQRRAKDLRRPQVSPGEDLIAKRVRVWWTVEREFYDGTVVDQRAAQNGGQELFIEYDDGDEEWHNTKENRIVEITEDTPKVSPVSPFRMRFTTERLKPPRAIAFEQPPPPSPKKRKAAPEQGPSRQVKAKPKATEASAKPSKAELSKLCRMTNDEFKAWQAEVGRVRPLNASGYRGLRARTNSRWAVHGTPLEGRKQVLLGTFDCKREAARAYDRFNLAQRGRDAVLNFHPRNYLSPEGDLLPAEGEPSPSTSATE